MPMKRRYERTPRLPLVGTIHLGVVVPVPNRPGVTMPRATDYFVVTERDNTPADAVKAFQAVYGEKPTVLDVIFPTADQKEFADRNWEAWTKGFKRVCKGDGETAMAKWDSHHNGMRPVDADGVDLMGENAGTWISQAKLGKDEKPEWTMREIPCLGYDCPMVAAKNCKPITHLMFFLPKVRLIGVWRISFGSEHGYDNIEDHLHFLERIAGRAHGIPVQLTLRPIQVTPPGERAKTVMVLDILPSPISLDELIAGAARIPENRLIAPPPTVDADDPWMALKYEPVPDDDGEGQEPDDLDREVEQTEPANPEQVVDGEYREVPETTQDQSTVGPDTPIQTAADANGNAPEPPPEDEQPPADPASDDDVGLAQRTFWAHQKDRQMDHRLTCLYLGMTETGQGAMTQYWLDPAEAMGLTRVEAWHLADKVIGDVLEKALDEQRKGNRAALRTAVDLIVPWDRMQEAAREKAVVAARAAGATVKPLDKKEQTHGRRADLRADPSVTAPDEDH